MPGSASVLHSAEPQATACPAARMRGQKRVCSHRFCGSMIIHRS